MLKYYFFIALITIAINPIISSESGVKFSVNSNIFNLVTKMDLSAKLTNLTLIGESGISYEKSTFPSLTVKISNLTISKFDNPEKIEINQNHQEKTVEFIFQNVSLTLKTSYYFRALSMICDQGKESTIDVVLDRFIIGLDLHSEKISVKSFDMKISQVDFNMNKSIMNFILKIFKSMIVNRINQSVGLIKESIESGLNSFVSSEHLVDLASLGGLPSMGIGLNYTITEKPKMDLKEKKGFKKNFMFVELFTELIKEAIHETQKPENSKKFLSHQKPEKLLNLEYKNLTSQSQNDNSITPYITGGIRGAIFATLLKNLKPNISEPIDMPFSSKITENTINVLMSDYTINTLLFFIQQSGLVNLRIQNDTNTYLPFNSDIEGFSTFFPQLKQKYSENFPIEVKINCDTSLTEPTVRTDTDGTRLDVNFKFELNVYNSTDIFDDPVKELDLDVHIHLQIQFMIDGDFLHILIFKTVVDDLNVRVNGLSTQENELKENIGKILNNVLDKFSPAISNVNVEKFFSDATGLRFDNFEFDTRVGYLEMAIDILNL